MKLLRATPGAVIYADVAGRTVPLFRHVYSDDPQQRESSYNNLLTAFQHLERHGLGVVRLRPGAWPAFVKYGWRTLSSGAQDAVRKWAIPLHFFEGFLEETAAAISVQKQSQTLVQQTARRKLQTSHSVAEPLFSSTAGRADQGEATPPAEGEPSSRQVDKAPSDAVEKDTYKEARACLLEEIPRTLSDATAVARKECLKAKPPCNVVFNTKRLVTGKNCAEYKLWGSCSECKPKCSLRARVTICIEGPAEGKAVVHYRGQHGTKVVAQGGRLLPADVQKVVNEVLESKATITSRGLRAALELSNLEFACEPLQLHNLVRRLRQKQGQTSSVAAVPIESFLEEVRKWEANLPDKIGSAEDLSRLLVLKSPNGVVVEADRVYVPITCSGMLQRLCDAANHRLRLIVDMKMGAIANNYGVITACFATSSARLTNTSSGMLRGRRQSYVAHTCTAQPVMQALVHSEKEKNVCACFEDLCWLCQEVGGFNLKSQLLHVHADYAPGIAAARRAVFPGARLAGDYFHYKKSLLKTLPAKLPKQEGPKKRGRQKRDATVTEVSEVSDLTRRGLGCKGDRARPNEELMCYSGV